MSRDDAEFVASQRVVFTAPSLSRQTCTFGIRSTKVLPASDMDKIDATDPPSCSPRMKKRQLDAATQARFTEAAEFNRRALRRLQKAFDSDPEADLLSLFPTRYSTVLAALKEPAAPTPTYKLVVSRDDVRDYLTAEKKITIIDPIADSLRELVQINKESTDVSAAPEEETQILSRLVALIQDSAVISSTIMPSNRVVVRCGAEAVAKVVWDAKEDFTEYTTLQFLQQHKPEIPAPRPLGLLRVWKVTVLFMSYFPGVTLEEAWPSLTTDQKTAVQDELETIFRNLRTLQLPPGKALGGVAGEACKDGRRHVRRSKVPILNVENFEDFQFSEPNFGSPEYINFLRGFRGQESYQVVFTHGDVRPANIIVNLQEHMRGIVVGIIDWEDSGFYPEYFEATKITNCLYTTDRWDWWSFLPPCISPHSYKTEWLRDLVWSRHLE